MYYSVHLLKKLFQQNINKMKIYFLIFLFVISVVTINQNFYRKVIHSSDPDAVCLDGSPGFLYFRQGSQKTKFMLYFLGGGFCGQTTLNDTLEDCYKRSKTQFGSSLKWPQFINDVIGLEGIISLNNDTVYKNWTKVIFGYCDGSIHQGSNANPIPYKDTKLYFKGNNIVRAHFKWLINNHQLDKATQIMLSGSSAGGIAAFNWGNYLLSLVKNPDNVYIVPDSGLFINTTTLKDNQPLIQQQIKTLMTIAQNTQKSPIQQCNKAYPGDQWQCLFIQKTYPYLKGKYLWINSQYDEWAIWNIMNIKCIVKGKSGATFSNCSQAEMKYIEDYRVKYMNFLETTIKPRGWGIWTIACSNHVYQMYKDFYDSDLQRIPEKTGLTVKDAMQRFIMQNKTQWTVDPNPWPSNSACAY